jgi:peptidoglycan/LPS O-acetylase OafA/YrhL
MNKSHSPSDSSRLHHLDALRGIAALSVLYIHCAGLVKVNYVGIHLFGHAPVIFFFILSGYVLTNSLHNKKMSFNIILAFYVKRIMRLYPAVLFSLLFAFLLSRYYYSPDNLKNIDIPQGYLIDKAIRVNSWSRFMAELTFEKMRLIPPLWTIKAELLGSALIPFLLILVKRYKYVAMPLYVLFALFLYKGELFNMPRNDVFAPQYYILPFFLGMMVCMLKPDENMPSSQTTRWVSLSCILLIVFTVNKYMTSVNTVDTFLSIILSMLFYVLVPFNDGFKKILLSPLFQFIGKYSFGIYLLHFPVLFFVWSIIAKSLPGFLYLNHFLVISVLFFLTMLPTIILSTFLFKCVEMPSIQLGKILAKKL